MMATRDEEQIRTKSLAAERLAGWWLAEGNEAAEKGNKAKAEKCYDKAQYWLDRYNRLTGNG